MQVDPASCMYISHMDLDVSIADSNTNTTTMDACVAVSVGTRLFNTYMTHLNTNCRIGAIDNGCGIVQGMLYECIYE